MCFAAIEIINKTEVYNGNIKRNFPFRLIHTILQNFTTLLSNALKML